MSADPCIYADRCAQYGPLKMQCNSYSGPMCKLWRLKKAAMVMAKLPQMEMPDAHCKEVSVSE